jgi:hypothetical protein
MRFFQSDQLIQNHYLNLEDRWVQRPLLVVNRLARHPPMLSNAAAQRKPAHGQFRPALPVPILTSRSDERAFTLSVDYGRVGTLAEPMEANS